MKRAFTSWKKYEAVGTIRRSRLIFKNNHIDVRILEKTKPSARILVVTPRKSGNAVQRNLFRRRFYALFYGHHHDKGDYDWIIFAKPGISDLSYQDILDVIAEVVQRCSKNSSSSSS